MLGFFKKIKDGLSKTHDKLTSEIKRIVTRSPRLTAESLEELEAALLGADLGMAALHFREPGNRLFEHGAGGTAGDCFHREERPLIATNVDDGDEDDRRVGCERAFEQGTGTVGSVH